MTEREIMLACMREEYRKKFVPVMRPLTARLLAEEVTRKQPKRILEIGTCVGLGTVETLLHCDGTVTTIEIDEDRLEEAKENVAKFGLTERCRFILDDCKEALPSMRGNSYDFVVLDGPKSYYPDAYSLLTEMLTAQGEIFMDDVLFYGLVEKDGLPERKHRTNVTALRRLFDEVKKDERVTFRKFDIEDGVLLVEKR